MVKSTHRKTIAIGFDSSMNGGTSRNSARNAAFLIRSPVLAARMGGRRPCRLASAVPGLSTRPSCRPHLTVGVSVFKQELDGGRLTTTLSRPCAKCGTANRNSAGKCIACENARSTAWRLSNPERAAASKAAWAKENQAHVKASKAVYRASHLLEEKVANAAWSAANPGRKNANAAAWRKSNPDRAKASILAWNATNSKRFKSAKSAWRKANPDKCRVSVLKWRAANPEFAKIAKHTRRAREKGAVGTLSRGLSKKLFALQKGKCPCCGLPLGDDYHMDHEMPLALGGSNTDDNMQLLRKTCNLQKHAKHPVDFMQERGFLL